MISKHKGITLPAAILLAVYTLFYILRRTLNFLMISPERNIEFFTIILVSLLISLMGLLGRAKLAAALGLGQAVLHFVLHMYPAAERGLQLPVQLIQLVFIGCFALIFVHRKFTILPLICLAAKFYYFAGRMVADILTSSSEGSSLLLSLSIIMGLELLIVYSYTVMTLLLYEESQRQAEVGERGLYQDKVGTNVFYTIFSLGLFGIVWAGRLLSNMKVLEQEKPAVTSKVLAYALVPFYHVYLLYRLTKDLHRYCAKKRKEHVCSEGLVVLLSLLGLNIIVLAMLQNKFNQLEMEEQLPEASTAV